MMSNIPEIHSQEAKEEFKLSIEQLVKISESFTKMEAEARLAEYTYQLTEIAKLVANAPKSELTDKIIQVLNGGEQ